MTFITGVIGNLITDPIQEWLINILGANYNQYLFGIFVLSVILATLTFPIGNRSSVHEQDGKGGEVFGNVASLKTEKGASVNQNYGSVVVNIGEYRIGINWALLLRLLLVVALVTIGMTAFRIPPFQRTLPQPKPSLDPSKSLILVADFVNKSEGQKRGFDPAAYIYEELYQNKGDLDVEVLRAYEAVDSRPSAHLLAEGYNCKYYIVIWGWYDALTINPYIEQSRVGCGGEVDLKRLSIADNTSLEFSITSELPRQSAILSFLALGIDRRYQDDFSGAERFLTRAYELVEDHSPDRPEFRRIIQTRADVFRLQKDFEGALRDYNFLVETDPENGLNYYNRALVYGDLGDHVKAVEDFTKAISLYDMALAGSNDDESLTWHRRRAFAFINIGEYGSAVLDLEMRADALPNDSIAHRDLGYAYRLIGNHDLAEVHLSRAIEIDPGDPDALTNRGILYLDTESYENALDDFSAAITVDPEYEDAYRYRAKLYELTKQDEARFHDIAKIVELDPSDVWGHIELGDLFVKRNQFDAAEVEYSKAIHIAPKQSEAYRSRGHVYITQGKFEKASADFDRQLELSPESWLAHRDMAYLLRRMSKFPEAIDYYSKTLNLHPLDSDSLFNRGLCYLEIGETQAARGDFLDVLNHSSPEDMYYELAKKELDQLGNPS